MLCCERFPFPAAIVLSLYLREYLALLCLRCFPCLSFHLLASDVLLPLRGRSLLFLDVALSCALVSAMVAVDVAPFDVLLEVDTALGVELDENGAVFSDVAVLEEVRPYSILVGFQLTGWRLRVVHSFRIQSSGMQGVHFTCAYGYATLARIDEQNKNSSFRKGAAVIVWWV